ncbi:MAG: hypothetical protein GY739_19825 [Mesoflavibacter sp.]|nr:hypothetical protein [Mesoflavibacter sp.]
MIKRLRITTLLLSISLVGFGQELPKEKSENHIQIKGTNIFMVPPTSFESSSNFKGFQNPNDQTSMIMAMEIPGPYSEVSKGFNSEMMQKQGMELKTKKEIKVAEFDGLLLELDQSANGMVFSKQIIIYGNEKSSTLINGVYLKDSLQLGEKIKESILTTFVDSKTESNPREALSYSLNENVGSLKFKSVMGNGMLLNRDLKTPTESADKATLLTDKSFAKVEINNEKLFCISRLKKYPDDYSVIPSKGINEIEIDNLRGFELFAKNNDKENEEMYQVILFDENGGYYLFFGTYVTGSEKAISDIKSVIQTFERKK